MTITTITMTMTTNDDNGNDHDGDSEDNDSDINDDDKLNCCSYHQAMSNNSKQQRITTNNANKQ